MSSDATTTESVTAGPTVITRCCSSEERLLVVSFKVTPMVARPTALVAGVYVSVPVVALIEAATENREELSSVKAKLNDAPLAEVISAAQPVTVCARRYRQPLVVAW